MKSKKTSILELYIDIGFFHDIIEFKSSKENSEWIRTEDDRR